MLASEAMSEDKAIQPPSVGRIVHYHAPNGGGEDDPGPYAGLIVRVHPGGLGLPRLVDLVTFGPLSIYHDLSVPFSPVPAPGHWSWPPRV